MLKHFLFDLDGVIVDTARFHFLSWRKLVSAWGIDLTEEFNEKLKGVSRTECLHIILNAYHKKLSNEEFEQALHQKNEDFLYYVNQMTEADILEGVLDFLKFAKANGHKIALASSSKNAKIILEKIGLTHYFDAIIDGNQITNTKPDPEIFFTAAKAIGASPENCVVFEDAIAGVEAGKSAGMEVIGIGDASILTKADIVVKSFLELKS